MLCDCVVLGATGAEAPGAAGEAEEEKTPPHISMVVTENVYHEPYKRDVMLKVSERFA